jgi:hypothetical protein
MHWLYDIYGRRGLSCQLVVHHENIGKFNHYQATILLFMIVSSIQVY